MASSFDDLPELLPVGDVAEYLHMSQEGVRRLIRSGRLEAIRPGRLLLITKDSLRAFLDASRGVVRRGPKVGTKRDASADADADESGAQEREAAPGAGRRAYAFPASALRPRVIG